MHAVLIAHSALSISLQVRAPVFMLLGLIDGMRGPASPSAHGIFGHQWKYQILIGLGMGYLIPKLGHPVFGWFF